MSSIGQNQNHSGITAPGIAMLIGATGFLILASTASVIAWKQWGSEQPADVATLREQEALLGNLQQQISRLGQANANLRAELEGLSGPGGVLPRMIERLGESRRVEAAHAAALRQILSNDRNGPRSLEDFNGEAQVRTFPSGPIQVTPVNGLGGGEPQRVVVTPQQDQASAGQGQ